jgi:hypothetical protein
MRRVLGALSVITFLLGVELSTEAASLALARLRSGVLATLSGVDFYVSGPRFGIGVAFLLVGTALWSVLLWSTWRRRTLIPAGACPRCGSGTRRVRRTGAQRWLGQIMEEDIAHRECRSCGWTGLTLTR